MIQGERRASGRHVHGHGDRGRGPRVSRTLYPEKFRFGAKSIIWSTVEYEEVKMGLEMDRQVMAGRGWQKWRCLHHVNLIPLSKDCQAQALIGLCGRISSLHSSVKQPNLTFSPLGPTPAAHTAINHHGHNTNYGRIPGYVFSDSTARTGTDFVSLVPPSHYLTFTCCTIITTIRAYQIPGRTHQGIMDQGYGGSYSPRRTPKVLPRRGY